MFDKHMSTEGWHNCLTIGTANPNGDPRDGFFTPTLTLMIDSNSINIIIEHRRETPDFGGLRETKAQTTMRILAV